MQYDFRMNSIIVQLQKIALLFKYKLNIIEPINEMIRNNKLLNEASKINQITHDLELENNGTGSK